LDTIPAEAILKKAKVSQPPPPLNLASKQAAQTNESPSPSLANGTSTQHPPPKTTYAPRKAKRATTPDSVVPSDSSDDEPTVLMGSRDRIARTHITATSSSEHKIIEDAPLSRIKHSSFKKAPETTLEDHSGATTENKLPVIRGIAQPLKAKVPTFEPTDPSVEQEVLGQEPPTDVSARAIGTLSEELGNTGNISGHGFTGAPQSIPREPSPSGGIGISDPLLSDSNIDAASTPHEISSTMPVSMGTNSSGIDIPSTQRLEKHESDQKCLLGVKFHVTRSSRDHKALENSILQHSGQLTMIPEEADFILHQDVSMSTSARVINKDDLCALIRKITAFVRIKKARLDLQPQRDDPLAKANGESAFPLTSSVPTNFLTSDVGPSNMVRSHDSLTAGM
jgi:hypothetical protein